MCLLCGVNHRCVLSWDVNLIPYFQKKSRKSTVFIVGFENKYQTQEAIRLHGIFEALRVLSVTFCMVHIHKKPGNPGKKRATPLSSPYIFNVLIICWFLRTRFHKNLGP